MKKLKNQLIRVQLAGEQLKSASIVKTKKAAEILGNETLVLIEQVIDVLELQNKEIEALKGEV